MFLLVPAQACSPGQGPLSGCCCCCCCCCCLPVNGSSFLLQGARMAKIEAEHCQLLQFFKFRKLKLFLIFWKFRCFFCDILTVVLHC